MDAENRSDQQKSFDHWLDSALRVRLVGEPRLGLEERVLARLASAHRQRFAWWPALATAAAVVVIAIAIALLRPTPSERTIASRSGQPVTGGMADRASVPTTESIHKRTHSVSSIGKHRSCCGSTRIVARAQREEHLPKLASFPTAHPETDQERMLAQLAAQLSAQRRFSDIANVSLDAPPKDLSITELRIDPLEGTSTDSNPH